MIAVEDPPLKERAPCDVPPVEMNGHATTTEDRINHMKTDAGADPATMASSDSRSTSSDGVSRFAVPVDVVKAVAAVSSALACIVCQSASPKYRCPKCLRRYCSAACCKAHKAPPPSLAVEASQEEGESSSDGVHVGLSMCEAALLGVGGGGGFDTTAASAHDSGRGGAGGVNTSNSSTIATGAKSNKKADDDMEDENLVPLQRELSSRLLSEAQKRALLTAFSSSSSFSASACASSSIAAPLRSKRLRDDVWFILTGMNAFPETDDAMNTGETLNGASNNSSSTTSAGTSTRAALLSAVDIKARQRRLRQLRRDKPEFEAFAAGVLRVLEEARDREEGGKTTTSASAPAAATVAEVAEAQVNKRSRTDAADMTTNVDGHEEEEGLTAIPFIPVSMSVSLPSLVDYNSSSSGNCSDSSSDSDSQEEEEADERE